MAKVRIQNFVVHGFSGFVCKAQIEKALKALTGVTNVQIHNIKNIVSITFDEDLCSDEDLMRAIRKSCSVEVIPIADSWQLNVKELQHVDMHLKHRLLGSAILTLLICLMSFGPLWGLDLVSLAQANTQIQLGLCIFVMALHHKCYTGGFRSFFHFIPEVNTLLALGTLAAFAFSCYNLLRIPEGFATTDLAGNFTVYFDLVAGVLTLSSLGQYFESCARNKIVYSLAHLYELAPTTVTRRVVIGQDKYDQDIYRTEQIATQDIQEGDVLLAKSGDKLGADGYVVEGTGYIDERELAGHCLLQRKISGSFVHCGSSVKYGYIAYKVTKVGADTTLAQIIAQPDESNSSHLMLSNIADRLAMFLVPVVISISLATFYVWLEIGAPMPHAISYAVAVLLVSCPGAISLAAPCAVMLVTVRALSFGVMIKNHEALENLSQLDIMVFDKTGIITKGNYKVSRFDTQENNPLSIIECLWIVRLLEAPCDHVLAHAMISYVDEIRKNLLHSSPKDVQDKILALTERQDLTAWEHAEGLGVSAVVNGKQYYFGSSYYVSQVLKSLRIKRDFLKRYEGYGLTTLYLFDEHQILMSFALSDDINPEAKYVVKQLEQLHIRSIIVSGDSYTVVERVAREVNIDTYRAWYLPQDKLTFIKSLERKEHYVGIVDSGQGKDETLEQSDVCITLASNLDFKYSNADIVLLHNNLKDLIPAVLLSKSVIKNIRQNLALAISYHLICLPLAAGCLAGIGLTFNPLMAVVLNTFSVLCVTLNALRLKSMPLTYKTDQGELIKLSETEEPDLDLFNKEAARFDAEQDEEAENAEETKSRPLSDVLSDILHDLDTREVRATAKDVPDHILVEAEKRPITIAPLFNDQGSAFKHLFLDNGNIEVSSGNILSGDDPRFLRQSGMSLKELQEWYQQNKANLEQGQPVKDSESEASIISQESSAADADVESSQELDHVPHIVADSEHDQEYLSRKSHPSI